MNSISEAGQVNETPKIYNSPRRLDYIDGFRGIAVAWVVLYHTWLKQGAPLDYWWNPVAQGYQGVNLFLILSGFCLYWPLVKNGAASKEPSLLQFAKRRAHRLFPPYYIALVISVLIAVIVQRTSPSASVSLPNNEIIHAIIWHVLLIHNLSPADIYYPNAPMWSLALEVQLYVAFPILVVIARKFGILRAVILAAVVTSIYRFGAWSYLDGPATASSSAAISTVLYCALPGRWFEFALGMLAARITVQTDQVNFYAEYFGLLGAAILMGIGSLATYAGGTVNIYNPWTDALYAIAFFVLIVLTGRGGVSTGGKYLAGLVKSPRLVKVGVMSYSLYLVHAPLLAVLSRVPNNRSLGNNVVFLVVSAFVLLIIFNVARLFHVCVEKPFMNTTSKTVVNVSNQTT